MRILIHVQHLLGIGHLQRTGLIAQALDAAGAAVTVLSGGMPWPGLDLGGARLVQLPPLRAGAGGFTSLIDAENRPLDETMRARRRQIVLDTLAETRPDLVLIETYPFGRRALRFELEPLVGAARAMRPRPALACSIRDIVAAKPDRPGAGRSSRRCARRSTCCWSMPIRASSGLMRASRMRRRWPIG
ncbi:MAG: hypothetical protein WDN69_37055 [Aliidongia sp.]